MVVRLVVPRPEEGTPTAGDDEVAWRRELKQLRVRVAQLEQERKTRLDPSLQVKRGDEHGYRCGSPCPVLVLDEQPRVECAACGTRLDPIEVLRDFAKHERSFCYSLEHLRKERADLAAEIKKLKALRMRLRGEVRLKLPEPTAHAGARKWDLDCVANSLLDHILARMPRDDP